MLSKSAAYFAIHNRTRHTLLADHVELAQGFWRRLTGLLTAKTLEQGAGLIIPACQAIHTIGMRFPIDVLFLDRSSRVLRCYDALPPGRLTRPFWSAAMVLELWVGALSSSQTQVNDQLALEPLPAKNGLTNS